MKEITEQEAREFIALKSGFVKAHVNGWNYPKMDNFYYLLPAYFDDSNQSALFWMREAEKTLEWRHSDLYANLLVEMLQPALINGERPEDSGAPHLSWPGVFTTVNASASNRAKAFIAVHGYKLKEGEGK